MCSDHGSLRVDASTQERSLPAVHILLSLAGQLQLPVVLIHVPEEGGGRGRRGSDGDEEGKTSCSGAQRYWTLFSPSVASAVHREAQVTLGAFPGQFGIFWAEQMIYAPGTTFIRVGVKLFNHGCVSGVTRN